MSKDNSQITVVVGMSGGVDSSVVALLLKKQGYRVVGLHMKSQNSESSEQDQQRVIELCNKIGIEYEIVNYSDQMQLVKDYFVQSYLEGITPNPCIICNKEVKFKPFIDFADKINADFFATGHYANILHSGEQHYLKVAKDQSKDQTYFLCQLSQKQLKKALFPLGNLSKVEVRAIAEQNGLVSAQTKDSYDVCFLGSQKFKDFMNKNYPEKEGDIIDIKSNKVVGKHTGISKYTLGQRRGLGIGGGFGEAGNSWFVVKKDIKNNLLYVAEGDGEALLSSALVSGDINWIPQRPQTNEFKCFAKFRYRQEPQEVTVKLLDNGKTLVTFDKKQRAITPGQYVVFYLEDNCLGGGVIEEVIK